MDPLNQHITNAYYNTMQASGQAHTRGLDGVSEKLKSASDKFQAAMQLFLTTAPPPPAPPAAPAHNYQPTYQGNTGAHQGVLTQKQELVGLAQTLTAGDLLHVVNDVIVKNKIQPAAEKNVQEQVKVLCEIMGDNQASKYIMTALGLNQHFPNHAINSAQLVKLTEWALTQEVAKDFDFVEALGTLIHDPQTQLRYNHNTQYQVDFLYKELGYETTRGVIEEIVKEKAAPQTNTITAPIG